MFVFVCKKNQTKPNKYTQYRNKLHIEIEMMNSNNEREKKLK